MQHCIECHGPSKQESGLRLDSREALFKGGDAGPAVAAGPPEESLLIEAVRHEGLEMPPEKKLDDNVIAALETWVRSGAVWPAGDQPSAPALGDQVALFEQAKTHWAFQPVRKPAVPKVRDAAWLRTPIDAFVLHKLEAAGLKPSAEADPATLCRRVYFDLVGLPPSVAEVDELSAIIPRPTKPSESGPTPRSSTSSWRRPTTANVGAGIGSTWPATPTRATSSPRASIVAIPMRTPIAIGS